MQPASTRPSIWTRHSSILLAGFLLTVFLIVYIWWPLAEEYMALVDWKGQWWHYLDWLLLGIFGFMSLTIMAGADLRRDALIIFVGMAGGLAIESWGTQTNLWHYYTSERPPLWIIPAWPIASLSIDRITRLMDYGLRGLVRRDQGGKRSPAWRLFYWTTLSAFLAIMLVFVAPTFDKTYTLLSCLLCVLIILRPGDERRALLVFAAGTGLGYFLERWGTTRECWTYYTNQTPPLFAVLAHGMAAMAFWRAGEIMKTVFSKLREMHSTQRGRRARPNSQVLTGKD